MPAWDGDLTDSGLLYEGNYGTWSIRMQATMRIQGFSTHVMREDRTLVNKNNAKDAKALVLICSTHVMREGRTLLIKNNAKDAKALALIGSGVSPELLTRISDKDREDPRRLWKVLKIQARPFRFLDLPKSVRSLVYRDSEIELTDHHRGIVDWEDGGRAIPMPPITRVSRLLRSETLVPFYATNTFELCIDLQKDKNPGQKITQAVLSWTEKALAENVKHIQSFYLDFSDPSLTFGEHCCVCFDYSREHGLNITGSAKVRDSMKRKLKDHGVSVEAMRRALDLQGEAIILALVSKPELWVKNILQ